MPNIGYAVMPVIPSAKGFGATLTKSLAPEMAASGRASGAAFAKGLALGAVGIAAVAVGIGVIATKMAASFQSATTLLVTGAGESEKSIELVRAGLLKMAPAVGLGPTALAKAMFLVESAGFHGAAGLLVMKSAAEGAKIGGADATIVANGLTTALTDYHLPANRAAEVTSKLVATVAAGKTTMGDLAGSLSTILPFASSFGVSLDDVAGAMATMTGEGINAATSATMLKFTMSSMANETPKGRDALKAIGITAQQLKDDLSKKGVGGALQDVTEAIGKKFPKGSVAATAALAAIVGGTRGMGTALALTGTHSKTLTTNIKNIGAAATEAGGHVKGWKTTTGDLNFQFDRAKALISSIAISIGNKLLPYVTDVVKWFNDFVTGMKNGTGPGGKLRDILTVIGGALKTVGGFLKDSIIPGLKVFFSFLGGNDTGVDGPFRAMAVAGMWLRGVIVSIGHVLGGLITAFKKGGLSGLAAQIGKDIAAALPVIVQHLAKWGAAFIKWIAPMIPPFLVKLGKIWFALEKWIYLTALPAIGKQLGKWAVAFYAWIRPMIPPFLRELGKLLGKLGHWLLTTALPAILKKLGEWALAFIKWVPGAALKLIVELGKLQVKLGVWLITTVLPWLIIKLAKWAGEFFRWVGPAAVKLIIELGKLGVKFFYWLGTTALPKLVAQIGKWALAFVKWVPGAALKLVKAGEALIKGLLDGLAAAPGKIWDAIKAVGGLIIKAVKAFFGIHSPSTVMAGLGGHIIGGLIQGIVKNKGQVGSLIGKVFGDVKGGIGGILGWLGSQGGGLLGKVLGGAGNLGKVFGSLFSGAGPGGEVPPGGAVTRWTGDVQRALLMLGQSVTLTDGVLRRIAFESGGNPNAINLTDSNAKAGHPSTGLMQTILGTFNAYAGPFRSLGMRNGMADIYAGLAYAISRYGSVAAIDPRVMHSGYALGTNNAAPGYAWVGERGPELVNFRGGETVVPNHKISGAGGGTSNTFYTTGYSPEVIANTIAAKQRQLVTMANLRAVGVG